MKTRFSEYVNVAETTKIFEVSQGAVRAWAEAGDIPMPKNPANSYRLFFRTVLGSFLDLCAQPVNRNQVSAKSRSTSDRPK